jgi:hypothetical protein
MQRLNRGQVEQIFQHAGAAADLGSDQCRGAYPATAGQVALA